MKFKPNLQHTFETKFNLDFGLNFEINFNLKWEHNVEAKFHLKFDLHFEVNYKLTLGHESKAESKPKFELNTEINFELNIDPSFDVKSELNREPESNFRRRTKGSSQKGWPYRYSATLKSQVAENLHAQFIDYKTPGRINSLRNFISLRWRYFLDSFSLNRQCPLFLMKLTELSVSPPLPPSPPPFLTLISDEKRKEEENFHASRQRTWRQLSSQLDVQL